jgi:hypothetical protein
MPALIEAEIVEQLRSGASREKLARRYGYSDRTITRIANDHGIAARIGAPSLAPDVLPNTRTTSVEEARERRRISDRLYRERRAKKYGTRRPENWGQTRIETPVQDLAAGQTKWRCWDCDTTQTGTHCLNGHEAPWVPLTKPLEVLR